MFKYVDAGLTTFDAADHYGPAEDLLGEFRRRWMKERGTEPPIQTLTKWVPRPDDMPRSLVEANVDRALKRLAVKSVDVMQFH